MKEAHARQSEPSPRATVIRRVLAASSRSQTTRERGARFLHPRLGPHAHRSHRALHAARDGAGQRHPPWLMWQPWCTTSRVASPRIRYQLTRDQHLLARYPVERDSAGASDPARRATRFRYRDRSVLGWLEAPETIDSSTVAREVARAGPLVTIPVTYTGATVGEAMHLVSPLTRLGVTSWGGDATGAGKPDCLSAPGFRYCASMACCAAVRPPACSSVSA